MSIRVLIVDIASSVLLHARVAIPETVAEHLLVTHQARLVAVCPLQVLCDILILALGCTESLALSSIQCWIITRAHFLSEHFRPKELARVSSLYLGLDLLGARRWESFVTVRPRTVLLF